MGLAGRQHDADGQAIGIGTQVELGREAAARAAESLTLGPPLPPDLTGWLWTGLIERISQD
ncbi:hypothetical protein GCM10008965_25300 [Methylorubrum aminovorans]